MRQVVNPSRFYLWSAVLVVAWVLWQVTALPAHVFNATRFILYDPGSYLYAVDCWLAGDRLYHDFAWQYGPLALGWFAGFAALLGNTPLALVLASSLAFAGAWVLVSRLVLRVAGAWWGWTLVALGLLPLMGFSGPYAFNGPHGAIEMLLFAACATVLASGGKARPWQLGILAGLLQWVRFGPHAAALVIILVIETWRLWPDRRAMVGFGVRLAAAYLLTAAPLAVWFFRALPPAGAKELLWPSHMVGHYAATFAERWPEITVGSFFTMWLPVVVGIALAVSALIRFRRAPAGGEGAAHSGAVAGLLFFPLYYVFGCAVLFRNDYAVSGMVWLAWPGLALLTWRTPPAWRIALLLALAPGFWAQLDGAVAAFRDERRWQSQPLALPNGQQLWFGPNETRNFAQLQAALAPLPPPRRLAIFIGSGGIHHFFQTQRVGRHWWYLPDFVRPWEAADAEKAILGHDMIFVPDLNQAAPQNAQPGVVALWLPLPPDMQARLLPHLKNPRRVGTLGTVVDIQH